MTNEKYSPLEKIISQEAFEKFRMDWVELAKKDYFEKKIGKLFSGFDPDLETAIEVLTCFRGDEPRGMAKRCESEVRIYEGSATKFQVDGGIVSLNLHPEFSRDLRIYARNIGGQMADYGKTRDEIYCRTKLTPFLSRFIALEAILPFLDEVSRFEPFSQPYFRQGGYFNGGDRAFIPSQMYGLKGTATDALKYIIDHRKLLGQNKEHVLKSAVEAMVDLTGINVFGYTNRVSTSEYGENTVSNYATELSRDTLRDLIKGDPDFDWINERECEFDDQWGIKFRDLRPCSGIRPSANLLAPEILWGAP